MMNGGKIIDMNVLVYEKSGHTFIFRFDHYSDLILCLHNMRNNNEVDFTDNDADNCLLMCFNKIGTF